MRLCFECRTPAIQQHHVVPQIMGGTQTVPLCDDCHGKVHQHNLRISTLTKVAMAHKRQRGEKTGGDVPYGYRLALDGKTLVIEPMEQTILKLVRREHREGLSVRGIVALLDELDFRTRKGTRFSITQVHRFIIRIRSAEGAA